jgi:protocatechuate 3,4-dioxygenase beta subunit
VNNKINSQEEKRQVNLLRHIRLLATFALTVLFWLAACSGQAIYSGGPQSAPSPQPTSVPTSSSPSLASPPPVQAQVTPPAPVCDDRSLTPSETEGPYFRAGSPERTSLLEPGMTGTKLVLTGYVVTADCKPVAHALLDFWQANAQGQYDNSGYTLRGHQFTDAAGRYQLITIVPGLYPGRTEHIHVKVQAPNEPILTTQLYFPGVSRNQTDSIFDPKLVMMVQDTGDGMAATFNFVVRAQ